MTLVELLALLHGSLGLTAQLVTALQQHPESPQDLRAHLDALELELDALVVQVGAYRPRGEGP